MYYRPAGSATPQLEPGSIHVWSCPLTVSSEAAGNLKQFLSAEECERAGRFRFEKHATAFIAAHVVLRAILSHYSGADPSHLEFGKSPAGKPFLTASDRLRFNLSHSGDLVLIAVALDREIGVDVELIRPMPDLEGIARRFFAPGERDDLLSLPPDCREAAFYKCWTRKEAFIKAIGQGLQYPLDRFRVTLLPHEPARFVSIEGGEGEWSLHDISIGDTYAAALAVEARDVSVECWSFDSVEECRRHFALFQVK